jgi:hypothetical protein
MLIIFGSRKGAVMIVENIETNTLNFDSNGALICISTNVVGKEVAMTEISVTSKARSTQQKLVEAKFELFFEELVLLASEIDNLINKTKGIFEDEHETNG